jgi:iron complex transport system substrate-binding protein
VLRSFRKSLPTALTIAFAYVAFSVTALRARAQTSVPGVPPAVETREIVDETGRTLRVPVSIERIVSLAPSLTETIYALGLQDRLVGDTDYCDYPPDALKKAKVGGAVNPNFEKIAALHPDIVLVTKSINRLDTVRALDTLGIPSYATDPHNVDEIISSTEKLATVLGAPDTGKSLGEDMVRRLAVLQTKLKDVQPSRVLFIVWMEPLISIGKDTFIADALHKAGAISIVDSAKDWPQTNLEEVVRLQPEYLVFAASHSESAARDFDVLASRPGWRILDAVHNRRFAVISEAVNRPAPRIVSAIEELARQLHPEAFSDAPPAPARDTAPSSTPTPPPQKSASPKNVAETFSADQECPCAR